MADKVLAKILTTGLMVPEDEVRSFPFDHLDLAVVRYHLDPPMTPEGRRVPMHIALEVPEATLRQRLLDPVRCAWVSTELHRSIGQYLGLAEAAVFAAAVRTGDPARVRLLMEIHKQTKPKEVHHKHVHMDFSQLTDEELKAFIADRHRVVEGKTIVLSSTDGQGEAETGQHPEESGSSR